MDTSSIITQVSKDDKNNNQVKLIPVNNNNNNQTSNQIAVTVPESYSKNEKKPFSLLDLFCCCFSSPPSRSGGAPYRKDNLDLQETFLLGPLPSDLQGKKTLVLDLDETLVHSSFKPIPNPDFVIPVEIEEQIHKVYVVKRPHVDQFMQRLGKLYEVVIFTASLSKYADPVLDLLDIHKVVRTRLFREHCSSYKGNYVKDLNRLGRDLNDVIIIDNSPPSYLFHPENAVPIETWFDDESDTELLDLIPFLEGLTKVENVRVAIEQAKMKNGKFT